MYDITRERHVGFLRHAVEHLHKRLLDMEEKLLIQEREIKLQTEIKSQLTIELSLLRQKFFAAKSEREPTKTNTKKNKRRKSQADLLCHNKRPVDLTEVTLGSAQLQSEEVIHATPEKTCCTACDLQEMTGAFEEASDIDVVETTYIVRRHKRQKYKCQSCKKIVTAPLPAKLKPGSSFSTEMAVSIACDKFHRHIPLNRQSEIMEERGLKVDTKTLYSLTENLASLVQDIPGRILAEIKAQPAVHIDESPMKILQDGGTSGYVWTLSNSHGSFYQFETTRSSKVAREMLGKYQGIVMADGYKGYDFIADDSQKKLVLCWAHVRRKFFDAMASYPPAKKAVKLIDELYAIEHEGKDFESLAELRRLKSTLVVDKIIQWKTDQEGKYLHASLVGAAIHYMTDHWLRLTHFLSDVQVPLDNNAAERSQRAAVMGRNNFQGFRTINGADTGMLFYTIIGSCKLLGLSPKLYLLETALAAAKKQPTLTPLEYARQIKQQLDAKMKAHDEELQNLSQ